METGIASEELIPAKSGERNLHSCSPRLPRDEICVDPVNGRLIHRLQRAGNGIERVALRNRNLSMFRAETLCHGARVLGLRVFGLPEDQRKCIQSKPGLT